MDNEMDYKKIIEAWRKWEILRMRMLKRCVKHNAPKAGKRYMHALTTSKGLFINNKLEEI